jgi:hypothetical protein
MGHQWGPEDEGDTRPRPLILPINGNCRRCKRRLGIGSTWIADVHLDGERPQYATLCPTCALEIHNLIWHGDV